MNLHCVLMWYLHYIFQLVESMQPLRPYEKEDTLKQFLQFDRNVLRFYCLWDDCDRSVKDLLTVRFCVIILVYKKKCFLFLLFNNLLWFLVCLAMHVKWNYIISLLMILWRSVNVFLTTVVEMQCLCFWGDSNYPRYNSNALISWVFYSNMTGNILY